MGAVVSHELGGRGELPPYIAIPNNHSFAGSTGFLSSTYGAFDLNSDPGQKGFKVRDFAIPDGVSTDRFLRRRSARVDVRKNCLDQMPVLDAAIAGLVTDLDQRGMLDTTLFWVTTEFGRTPKVNSTSGRDHWARCYSNLLTEVASLAD